MLQKTRIAQVSDLGLTKPRDTAEPWVSSKDAHMLSDLPSIRTMPFWLRAKGAKPRPSVPELFSWFACRKIQAMLSQYSDRFCLTSFRCKYSQGSPYCPNPSLFIQSERSWVPMDITYPVPAGGTAGIGATNQHLLPRFLNECDIVFSILLKR